MTDPAKVPLPASPVPSPVRSPFSPIFSPTSNHPISPLTFFTPLPSGTPQQSHSYHASSGPSRQHTGGSSTPYHAQRPSIAPSDSVSTAPSRRSSSYGVPGASGTSFLRSVSPAGQGPFRPRLDRNATIRRDMGASTMQHPQDPFYEGVTIEVNQPVGSLSISPSNRDVCLASRKGLYIIDLANLHNAPRFVPQGGTWQIADCQWSPHPATSNMILSTSSQKLLVWDLAAQVALRHSVDAHARAITDINWHARDPNLMATASMDAGIRGWDLRCLNRPYMRVCAWGEAVTQIKWNRQHDHLFATAHGKEVLIWDNRKGSVPVVNWKAHDSKIYGIDWDREHRHKLVTCSLDQTVKYWTVSDLRTFGDKATHTFYPKLSPPAQASSVVKTGYPVWRARNLPFGHGVIALPQRGGEDLEMFALGNDKPVHTFEGHTNVVKDFVWRSRGGNDPAFENREFQLVTWSKDQTLRIWPVPRDVTESVGYQYGAPITVLVSRRGARDITYTTTHRADDKQVVPMPIVNQPSGLSKTRNAPHQQSHGHHKEVGGMTRGGKKVKVVDQLDWLTKVIKNKASPEASAWQSRIGSVSARGSRSGSRERMRGVSQGPGMDRSATLGSSVTGGELMSLKDEIVIVNQLFPRPKVRFAKIDLHHKKLTMEMSGPWANGDRMAFCRIHWSFPAEYPNCTEIPTFELERNPTVSPITRQKLVMTLKEIRAADKQCLVQTCAFLLGHHEVSRAGKGRRLEEDSDSESETGSATDLRPISGKTGTNVVMMIRNCGATFGPNGQLVCFFPKRTVLPRIRPLNQNTTAINTYANHADNAGGGREPPTLIKAMSALSSLSRTGASDSRSHAISRLALRRAQMGITLGIGAAFGFTDNSVSTVQAGSTVTIHSIEVAQRHQGALASTAGADGFSKALAKEYGVPTDLRDIERMVRVAEKHKRIDHLLVLHALWGAIGSYEPRDDEVGQDGHVSPPPPYSEIPEASGSRERWEYSLTRRKVMVDRVFQTLMDNRDVQMLALASILVLLHVRVDPPPPHLLDPRDQVTMVSPVQDYFGLPLPRNHSALSQPIANPRSRGSMYANSQGFPSPLIGPTSAPGHGLTNIQYDRHSRGSSAPHAPHQTGQPGQWSFHPSSASLRALGAMTPRDRGSFDALARTPFGMSVDFTSPQLSGTGQSAVPASVWASGLMGRGKSPRSVQHPHRQASMQHRDSDLGVQIQERPRHPVMGRRQRLNSRAAAPREGDESGAETPRAQPRSAEGTGDMTPVVRPNSSSGSAFAGASAGSGAGTGSAITYGQSGIYATTGIAPLRSAGTDQSYASGNGSYGRSGFQNSLPRGEQEVGSAGSVKWFGSPAKRKSAGPAPGASSVDLRSHARGEKEGLKAKAPSKICGVRIEVIQPGQDRFDNDARHVPIGYPQYTQAMQSVSATLLSPERLVQCHIWRSVYADLLLRSELYLLRAEVLQYDFVQPPVPNAKDGYKPGEREAESGIACVSCVEVGRGCCSCEKRVGVKATRCSYCRLPIRGLYTTCTLCAHRTHLACFRLHSGIDGKDPSHPSTGATCAACPCRCLSEGGLTGAVISYGPPPPLALDTSMLPYDESGMLSDLYPVADVSTSPEIASSIAMPTSATSVQPPSRTGTGVDQYPFPSTRRPAERGLSGLRGTKGVGAGGRRSGASGSPRRSVSQSGSEALPDGQRSASSSGIVRLGRAGTASAALPTAASSHARGLANMGTIAGASGVGLGLGLKSVAESDGPPSPGISTVPHPSGGNAAGLGGIGERGAGRGRGRRRGDEKGGSQSSPMAPLRGETLSPARPTFPAGGQYVGAGQAGGQAAGGGAGAGAVWSSIYGYANPYANFQAAAPTAAVQGPGPGHRQGGGDGHEQAGQGQAQGAQGLLARARAAMDAGGAWR